MATVYINTPESLNLHVGCTASSVGGFVVQTLGNAVSLFVPHLKKCVVAVVTAALSRSRKHNSGPLRRVREAQKFQSASVSQEGRWTDRLID